MSGKAKRPAQQPPLSFEDGVARVRAAAFDAAETEARRVHMAHGWDVSRLLDSASFDNWGRNPRRKK